MARSAYILLAFVNIGLVPDAGATWLVAKGVGRAKALEMALLGEKNWYLPKWLNWLPDIRIEGAPAAEPASVDAPKSALIAD